MATAGRWQPVRDSHAIEVVAAMVQFEEPLSSTVMRKVLRAANGSADSVGLVGQPVQTLSVNIPAQGLPQMAHQPAGVEFSRQQISEENGLPATNIVQSFVVQPEALRVIERNYNRWSHFRSDIHGFLYPVLGQALLAARVGVVRLEYIDRFVWSGERSGIVSRDLLREGSPWISPHVFQGGDAWHSHTGKRVDGVKSAYELTQIRIETRADQASQADPSADGRNVAITTAIQYEGLLGDPDEDQRPEDVIALFDDLHNSSKALFLELITDEIAGRIGLGRKG